MLLAEASGIQPCPTASERPIFALAHLMVAVHGADWDETAYVLSRPQAHRQLLGYEYAVTACAGSAELLGPCEATLVLGPSGRTGMSHTTTSRT